MIDGGNSYFHDDLRRARGTVGRAGLHYVDVGTSGGVLGLERGYCLMIGGEADIVGHLDPIFAALAPGGGGGCRARRPAHRAAPPSRATCTAGRAAPAIS